MYFNEFEKGKQKTSPEKRISSQDIDDFLNISGLNLAMFQHDEGARARGHEKRLVPGPMIFSMAMGLVSQTRWFDQVVAVLEFEALRFVKTVHPNDSIKVNIRVKETRQTQSPDLGLVILSFNIVNQKDETVLLADGRYLIQIHPK